MRTVVSGATGFVGKWLVDELLKQNDEVTVLVRDKSKAPETWNSNVRLIEAELSDYDRLGELHNECDLFFHLAWAGTSGTERADTGLQLKNVQAACDAVRLAKKWNCKRFVFAGSIMEYEAMNACENEAVIPGLGNIYSTAKLCADYMAKTVAANVAIEYIKVNISNIYGVGERSARFLNTTIQKMQIGERIPLTHGNQLYDFIYVSDAVRAIVLAGKEAAPNGSYYIGSKEQRPLKDYILTMHRVLQSKSELAFGEVPVRGAELDYTEFDTSGLYKLGFSPEISFEEGVLLTADWLEDNYEHRI